MDLANQITNHVHMQEIQCKLQGVLASLIKDLIYITMDSPIFSPLSNRTIRTMLSSQRL